MRPARASATLALIPAIVLPIAYGYSRAFPSTTQREIHIPAPPAQVWKVLTDFDSFEQWNPHIIQAEGSASVGSQLSITITESGSLTHFTPEVLVAEPGLKLQWLGHFLFPGLADGLHTFTLTPQDGGTLLTQTESFTGVVAPLTPLLFDLGAAFEASNAALRDRVLGS